MLAINEIEEFQIEFSVFGNQGDTGTPLKHHQQQIHQRQIGHSKNRNPHKSPPTQSPIETATKHIGDCGRKGDYESLFGAD